MLSLCNMPCRTRSLGAACRLITKIKNRVITCGFARFGSGPVDGLLVGAFAFNVNNAVSHSSWAYDKILTMQVIILAPWQKSAEKEVRASSK